MRQAAASGIVADQCMVLRKPRDGMPSQRAFPIVFEVGQPVRRADQRRPLTNLGPSEPDTIRSTTVVYLLFRCRHRCTRRAARARAGVHVHCKDFDRLRNVFQLPRAEFPNIQCELTFDLIVDFARYENLARLRNALQSGRDVDAIAVDAVRVVDYVADIEAYSELHMALRVDHRVVLTQLLLDPECTLHRVYDARELR